MKKTFLMKKILFPFYKKEKHSFLFEKKSFRLIIFLYPIFLLYIANFFFMEYMDSFLSCYQVVIKSVGVNSPIFESLYNECRIGVYESLFPAIGYSFGLTLYFYYLLQFIFFSIVINYIVLGNKK